MENDGLRERGFPVQTVPMTAKIRPNSTLTPKTWLRVGTTPRRVAMPFREIYPWLARALSPGCYLHVLEPCNVSFWGKKRKRKNGGFSRLVDWYESEREEERKKENKRTHGPLWSPSSGALHSWSPVKSKGPLFELRTSPTMGKSPTIGKPNSRFSRFSPPLAWTCLAM